MEDGSSVCKLFFLHILSVYFTSADTHTLQHLYTAVSPVINLPEFTAVGLLDVEQFMYYDSNISETTPRTEWIKEFISNHSDHWNRERELIEDEQDRLRKMLNFIHTEGRHVLQLMYGCADDNSTTSYLKFGYNGDDFFHLDLKTGTLTPDKHQAENFIKDWDPKRQTKKWKEYLETDCIDWLNTVVSYGRETLERKVRPKVSLFQSHSSSPEVVCHATGFFPKALNITWQKDKEDVYEDVELSETLPNLDGSFQRRSVLNVLAEELQKHNYTCVIQHSSLEEDLVLPESERRILTDGGSAGSSDEEPGGLSGGALSGIIVGVVLALIAFGVGIFFWKNINPDYRATPREENHNL